MNLHLVGDDDRPHPRAVMNADGNIVVAGVVVGKITNPDVRAHLDARAPGGRYRAPMVTVSNGAQREPAPKTRRVPKNTAPTITHRDLTPPGYVQTAGWVLFTATLLTTSIALVATAIAYLRWVLS